VALVDVSMLFNVVSWLDIIEKPLAIFMSFHIDVIDAIPIFYGIYFLDK
jgi:hypothetical protein